MARKTNQELLDAIRANRLAAQVAAGKAGTGRMVDILAQAQALIMRRLEALVPGDFTLAGYMTALEQIADVVRQTTQNVGEVIQDDIQDSAMMGAEDAIDQLTESERTYRGLGEYANLPIDEAMVYDQAVSGANSSVLRRLGGDPETGDPGILERYGIATIGNFEDILKVNLLAGASMDEVVDDLTDASPFLQGAPRYWAERIARTENMNAYNHASWESMRSVEDQTGEDMLKILVEIDDDRTAWDSYAVHGQVRRMDEPFEWVTYRGETLYYVYPPNRPNDRATVVSWNPAWGKIPDELQPFDEEMYIAAWYEVYKKRQPPERPQMTTLDDMSGLW